MSNTESVRQAGANTAPIHSSSISKLRSIGGGGASLGLGENDATNWLDAFAEIFARMSASDAAPQDNEVAIDPETQQSDATVAQSDNDQSGTEDRNDNQAEEGDSSTEERISLELPVAQAEVIETKTVELENIDNAVDLEVDQDTETLVNVLAVEVQQAVVAEVKPETIVESFVAEQNRDKNQGKKDQGVVIADQQESRGKEIAVETKQVNTTETVGPELGPGSVTTASDGAEQTDDDSNRRSRRGRKDRDDSKASDNAAIQDNVESNASKRSGGIPISVAEGLSSESASLPPKQEIASAIDNLPKPSSASAAAVQAVAKLAASAAASGRATSATAPTGLTGNVQPAGRVNSPVAESAGKKPTTPNNHSETSEAVNRAKLMQRVSKAFQQLGPEGGHVRLRLAPAELGTVRLEMHIQDRRVQARVVAESEAAASVLREHLPELRQRLESQGIQIERFQIDVESGDGDSRPSMGREHAETQQRGQDGQPGHRHFGPRPDRTDVSQKVSQSESHHSDFGGPLVTVPIGGGVDVRL